MLKHCTLALAGLALAGGFVTAQAEEFQLVVRNKTGAQIDHVYLTPSSFQNWVPVSLDPHGLGTGEGVHIRVPADWQQNCYYNLKVEYNNGPQPTWHNFDICHTHSVTLSWDRGREMTHAAFQ